MLGRQNAKLTNLTFSGIPRVPVKGSFKGSFNLLPQYATEIKG